MGDAAKCYIVISWHCVSDITTLYDGYYKDSCQLFGRCVIVKGAQNLCE